MKKIIFVILSLSMIALFACRKDEKPYIDSSDKLLGYWVNPEYVDTVWKYERAASLKENEYGFSLQADGSFIERKNSGWCGTPPIHYSDFEGIWSKNSSEVNISVGYWGGTAYYQWRLISAGDEELVVYIEEESYGGQ